MRNSLVGLLTAALVCTASESSAAEKIRIAVANFNVSFMTAGVAAFSSAPPDLLLESYDLLAERGLQAWVCGAVTAADAGSRKLEIIGRGERIRTSDLSVPNHRFGKKLSFCHFESCSHHEFIRVLRFFPIRCQAYMCCAENSVHKLATRFGVNPSVETILGSSLTSPQSFSAEVIRG